MREASHPSTEPTRASASGWPRAPFLACAAFWPDRRPDRDVAGIPPSSRHAAAGSHRRRRRTTRRGPLTGALGSALMNALTLSVKNRGRRRPRSMGASGRMCEVAERAGVSIATVSHRAAWESTGRGRDPAARARRGRGAALATETVGASVRGAEPRCRRHRVPGSRRSVLLAGDRRVRTRGSGAPVAAVILATHGRANAHRTRRRARRPRRQPRHNRARRRPIMGARNPLVRAADAPDIGPTRPRR